MMMLSSLTARPFFVFCILFVADIIGFGIHVDVDYSG